MLHHWLHLYADGAYQACVDEHAHALQVSGLADALDGIHLGVVGSDQNRAQAIQRLRDHGLTVTVEVEAPIAWEQVTLEALRRWSTVNDGHTLYTHTKGSANVSDLNTAWRRSMTHHNVTQWRTMTAALDTHDVAGCHWITEPEHRFYGGNFWWARNTYLRTLPWPKMLSRYYAEVWIGTNNPTPYDANPGFPNMGLFKVPA